MAFQTVFFQVFILFLLMAVGFGAGKAKMLGEEGAKQLTSVLLSVVSPCVIIISFQMKFSKELVHGLIIAAVSAFVIHLLSILCGLLVFRRRFPEQQRKILRFAAVYSNSGFMGIPLLQAIIGPQGIFYGSAYLAVFNLFSWTHGVMVFTGKTDRKSVLKAIMNPNIIAVLIGLILFSLNIRIPSPFYDTLHYIYDLNTPLSMLVIGSMMTKLDFRSIFQDITIWPGILLRNLAMPLLLLFMLHMSGIHGVLLLACVIQASCPVAGNTVLFSEMYGGDTIYASKVMSLSTLFSIVSIPLVLCLAALH